MTLDSKFSLLPTYQARICIDSQSPCLDKVVTDLSFRPWYAVCRNHLRSEPATSSSVDRKTSSGFSPYTGAVQVRNVVHKLNHVSNNPCPVSILVCEFVNLKPNQIRCPPFSRAYGGYLHLIKLHISSLFVCKNSFSTP